MERNNGKSRLRLNWLLADIHYKYSLCLARVDWLINKYRIVYTADEMPFIHACIL